MIENPEESKRLADAASARILLISDSHGAPGILKFILSHKAHDCDALVFAGDGLQDLFLIYSTNPELFPKTVCFVRGNNDGMYYSLDIEGENKYINIPDTDILKAAGHRIFVAHGHRSNVYIGTAPLASQAKRLNCDIACFGHIHFAYEEIKEGIKIINPGSCSRPRGGQPPVFAILNLQKGSSTVETEFFEIKSSDCVPFEAKTNPYSLQ